MSKREKGRRKTHREKRRYTSSTAMRAGLSRTELAARQSWPVLACYVPDPDVWRVSGFGGVAIFRENPNGTVASALFCIELISGGIVGIFGRDDHLDMSDAERLLQIAEEDGPPFVRGEPDLASRFAYGAYAFGLERGFDFPLERRRPLFGLLPPLSGTTNWWLQQFASEDMTPARLIQVVRQIDVPDDLPEGKEVVCFTTAIFDTSNPAHALSVLMSEDPEFIHEGPDNAGRERFIWTREYPKHHDSPLASLGGRQIIGDLTLCGTELRASAKVLSMAGRLVSRLKQLMGESLRLRHGEWQSVADLLETG